MMEGLVKEEFDRIYKEVVGHTTPLEKAVVREMISLYVTLSGTMNYPPEIQRMTHEVLYKVYSVIEGLQKNKKI